MEKNNDKKEVSGFSISECVELINYYQEQALKARTMMDEKVKKNALFALKPDATDPGEFYETQASIMQNILNQLVCAKAEKTSKEVPGFKKVSIIGSEGVVEVGTAEKQIETPNTEAEESEKLKDENGKTVDTSTETEVEAADPGNLETTDEEVEKEVVTLQNLALEDADKRAIYNLVASKKEGIYMLNADGRHIPATDADKSNVNLVVEQKAIYHKAAPAKFKAKEQTVEGKTTQVKGDLILGDDGFPSPVSKKDLRDKNIIVDQDYIFVEELEVVRTKHDIERAVDLVREHLKGQGVDVSDISYRDLKARAKGYSQEISRADKETAKKSITDKIEALKFKAERAGVEAIVGDGLTGLKGQYKKGDEFDVLTLTAKGKLKSEDKMKLTAIRLCAAGDRKAAVSLIHRYYQKQGVTIAIAEAIMNKLMGEDPYKEVIHNVENLLLSMQLSNTDVPDGYKKGLHIANSYVKSYSEVFVTDSKGNRKYEDEAKQIPVMKSWTDDKVKKFVDDIVLNLIDGAKLPAPVTAETADDGINPELKRRAKEKVADNTADENSTDTENTDKGLEEDSTKKNQNDEAKQTSDVNSAEEGEAVSETPSSETTENSTSDTTDDTESGQTESSTTDGDGKLPIANFQYKVFNGNAAQVTIKGTSFTLKTRKTGEALSKQIKNKFKDWMGQVMKSETRHAKNSKGTEKMNRPEGFENWKAGDDYTFNLQPV